MQGSVIHDGLSQSFQAWPAHNHHLVCVILICVIVLTVIKNVAVVRLSVLNPLKLNPWTCRPCLSAVCRRAICMIGTLYNTYLLVQLLVQKQRN